MDEASDAPEPFHPNDQVEFKQYPDRTHRETYPPLPSRGRPTNVPMPEDVASSWAGNAEQAKQRRERGNT